MTSAIPELCGAGPRLPNDLTDWRAWVVYGEAWARHAGCQAGLGARPRPRTVHAGLGKRPNTAPVRPLLRLESYREGRPGRRWQQLFDQTWPAYRSWYLSGDSSQRPSLAEAKGALQEHLPELVPVWQRLVELSGGDPLAARLLTMWRLPAFVAGCTQAVAPGREPVLVRNYDYDPALFEGVVASTNWSGRRKVIGTSDLLWGLLDGINEDGLAVSLTWGGRPGAGRGFGIPLVVRYLLETCATVEEAVAALRRIPVAQAYNLTLADTAGSHATVFVAPGEEPEVSRLPAAANHRLRDVADSPTAYAVRSGERQAAALDLVLDNVGDPERLGEAFVKAPLHNPDHSAGWGTLYTAVLEPARGRVTYHWPGRRWTRHLDDEVDSLTVRL